jgi:5'-nucleotidase
MPPHPVAKAVLEHKRGHKGSYHVKLAWGDELEQPIDTDTGAVLDGYVSLTWLSRLQALPTDGAGPFDALDDLLTR